MTRGQKFATLLVLIVLMAVWYSYGDKIKAANSDLQAAKKFRSGGKPA